MAVFNIVSAGEMECAYPVHARWQLTVTTVYHVMFPGELSITRMPAAPYIIKTGLVSHWLVRCDFLSKSTSNCYVGIFCRSKNHFQISTACAIIAVHLWISNYLLLGNRTALQPVGSLLCWLRSPGFDSQHLRGIFLYWRIIPRYILIRMGSREGPTMRNFIVCTVYL